MWSHEPVALGEGLKHGIGVGPKFEFARAKGTRNGQSRRLAITAMAVDAEVIVDGLALGEILRAQLPENPSVITVLDSTFAFFPKTGLAKIRRLKTAVIIRGFMCWEGFLYQACFLVN